ncbi:MAG: hypothetical protein H6627_03850 [Calditrichae bacterium]|nr:hypothetical protein [Calditrichota bacterium]MCB9057674.1 hypothetical protein [Calditrichia bacterium]
MTKKIVLLLLILAAWSCTTLDPNQDPNPSYTVDGRYGNYVSDTLYAIADSINPVGYAVTGFADKLIVGNLGGIDAGFLINFVDLPADTVVVDSAFVNLTTVNSFGNNATDKVDVEFYTVLETWDSYADTISTWRNPPLGEMLGQVSIAIKDSSKNKLKIPDDVFYKWRSENDSLNTGLYVKLSDSYKDVVCEFGSLSSSNVPFLTYHTHTDTSSLIDTMLTSRDVTIFNYDSFMSPALEHEENTILISSGVINNILLKFDLDQIPADAIYYSADLILTGTDKSDYENPENKSSFLLRPVEDITSGEYSPNKSIGMIADGSEAIINGTYKSIFASDVIQEIKNGSYTHQWFSFSFLTTDEDLSVKYYYGAKADLSVAPKLIVKYLKANNQE